MWQEIVKLKYIKDIPICLIKRKIFESPIWSDLLKIRHIYLRGGEREYKINNGERICFLLDSWMGGPPYVSDIPSCMNYAAIKTPLWLN
jgi:hypothetical protein